MILQMRTNLGEILSSMTHQPNRNNFPYPIPVEYQNAHNSPNPHLKDEQRMLNESLRSGYPQNINYPSQRPIQFKKTVNDASNSSKNYLSMESSDFKSFTSNIKPIQQHHQIPSIKPNQINQTIHVPKSTYQNINSSYTNKPINYSMNQHKQDANKSKSQSIHGLTNQTVSNLSSLQIHTKPSASVQFHPSYFLLSKFPQLTPKDQIYMPIINRLQNNETKYCFHQLYINLKFLLVQSNEQFWKYLSHLHLISMNGLSDEQIREGYKLRLSLQSCLSNFSIKEFNKCVNLDEVKSSSVAISKRIYKYENIFNSSSFQLYDKLFHTVIEFFQRIVKTRNPYEINIITSSWYLDTLKIMQLATIYGSKQPSRVKQLIKNMLNLEPKLYTRDFVNFIRKLHQYIDSSVYNDNSQQAFSLLQQLNKKLQAVPNKYKHKSNFHNPQKYFGREIFFICSDCLKLFIYVTNIFKFFPSRLKLIFMENTDFLRVLIKISIRVIYNLRVQHAQKKRWKLSAKIKSLMKNLQFILLQKITQMYKFIFLNTKNALQQQIFENDNEDQKTKEQIRQEKIVLKFYKKLIEGTVNRKKDPQKDSFLTHFLNQQSENISESNFSQTNQELVTEKEQNEKSQSESNENESIDLMQQKSQKQNSKDVKLKSEKMNTNNTTKTKNKQQKKIKKEKIPENEYGRVLIKHLLRKQLKKDSNKYRENGYFYTNKLYNYFRQKVRSQKTTKRKSSQLNVSNQQEQQKSIQSIQRGFFKYLLVLEQFQNEVKQQYRTQQQINERFRRVELIMRQLPSLGEFRKREQRMEYDQLMRRLNQGNVQYEDQPTEEQQLEMEWNQRVLDEDDFTRIDEGMLGNQSVIHFNISTQHKQQQQKEQKVSNNNNNHSKSIINFNNNINNNNNNNQSFTSLFNANLSQSQISNQWTFIGKQWTFIGKITNKNKNNNNNNKNNNNNNINNMRYNNNKVRYFEGESSEQLSPQQITDQQLLAQQILSKQSIIANDHSNNNNSNVSNILGNNNTIFKPHEQLKTLSYSMIKQQLQYFNKVKNLNWHQISRISTNNRKNKTNKTKQNNISDTSQDQVLMRFNQMIKVQDIGLSFDMILGDSDEQQVQQNGVSNFSYFYYNQWKHQSTRHKKKSFMDDYSWTHINQTQSNNNQTKSGNNNRSGKQQRQLQQQQSNKFKKTKKMKGQYQQQEQHQQHQHQQKQQNSNINSKKEKYKQSKINQRQQYVRRDYANYMSNSYYNNSSSNKYPHYHPVAGNRINQQQYPQQYKGSHNQFNPMNPINPINPMNSSNPINPIDPMNPLNNSNSYSRMYNQPYSPHTPPNNFINHPPSNYNNPQYRMNNK